jgi:Rod binding domain-containing protein
MIFRQMLESARSGARDMIAGAGMLDMLGDQAFAGQIARSGGFGLSDYLSRLLARSPAGSTLDVYEGSG